MNLKKGGLKDFLPGPAGRDIGWLPRILGTLIGLLALGEFIEGLGYFGQLDTRGSQYLIRQRVSIYVRSPMRYFCAIVELCAATHFQRPSRLTQISVNRN